MEEFKSQETKAPFNMAISTLEALRSILSDIKRVYEDPYWSDAMKQKLKVHLVRRFYVDSSPLLNPEVVKKYKNILNLQPKEVRIIRNNKLTNDLRVIFDWSLEIKLDNYLLEIQRELQKEKYFMPPREDLGTAVGRFQ